MAQAVAGGTVGALGVGDPVFAKNCIAAHLTIIPLLCLFVFSLCVILERSEESRFFCYESALKSRHVGFSSSISAIFLDRSNPLICFSAAIASVTSLVS